MLINKKIPLSYIARSTYKDFLVLGIFTTLSFLLHLNTDFFTIPISISTFLGTAISLVLSFNLAQSYERWWEARKIWGEIVNDSRSLVLQLKHFTSEAPFFLLTVKHLQNPFENVPSDVPIYSISRNIEINLLALIEEENIPKPVLANGFYIN